MLCCTVLMAGCSKSDKPVEGDPPGQGTPDIEGEKTAPGIPDNTPKVERAIGAAGGEIVVDGKIKVVIPAGALATTQTIGLQRISNTNPLGAHPAWRITPHGQQFSKPVQITFPYTDAMLKGTHPELMGIAYQNSEGIWMAMPVTLNATAKTLTVNTTHFSDWSLFEALSMYVAKDTLPVFLKSLVAVNGDEDLALAPLTPKERAIQAKKRVKDLYIKNWRLIGAGAFQPNGAEGVYTAPGAVGTAPQNPATLTVEFRPKNGKVYMLLREITTTAGYIEVKVDGGDWIQLQARNANKIGDSWFIQAQPQRDSRKTIAIHWKGEKGTFLFSEETEILFSDGIKNYTYLYQLPNSNETLITPGSLKITDIGDTDNFVDGTFVMEKCGVQNDLREVHRIEGRFSVMRNR